MSKQVIFDRKNVLVTGGAGFIGSHLCDELVKTCKVICVDNFITGRQKNIDHLLVNPNFAFINHDINKPFDIEKFPSLQKFKIEFQGIQEIYHLACPVSVLNFETNIPETLTALSVGTKSMLDLAVKYSAKFLHFSSSVVYGPRKPDNLRMTEDDLGAVDILSKRSSYDEGKRFAETLVENYKFIHKLDAKIMRVFRTYGPRMPLGDGQMIPDFIENALDGKDLIIFGDDEFKSSFCYVSDVVDAALLMMKHDIDKPLNIGSDVDIKLSDLANKIIEMTKSKSKVSHTSSVMFMSALPLPDISRAAKEIGWIPIVTLTKGLEKTIHDLMAHKSLKGVKDVI